MISRDLHLLRQRNATVIRCWYISIALSLKHPRNPHVECDNRCNIALCISVFKSFEQSDIVPLLTLSVSSSVLNICRTVLIAYCNIHVLSIVISRYSSHLPAARIIRQYTIERLTHTVFIIIRMIH